MLKSRRYPLPRLHSTMPVLLTLDHRSHAIDFSFACNSASPGNWKSPPNGGNSATAHSRPHISRRAWPTVALGKCVLSAHQDEKGQVRKKDKVHKGGRRSPAPAPWCTLGISKLKVMRFNATQRGFLSLQASLSASQGAEPPREKKKSSPDLPAGLR